MNIKPQNTDILTLKNYIFDPLTTIIKLAVLKNKKVGTKISIKDNIIYIQEIGMFQSIVRYYNGNTKNDLHYLSIPIEFACGKYINTETITRIPDIMIIFKSAQDGLLNLMETYNDYPIIVHCLKYYYSIIETHINEQICDKNCILKQKYNKIPNIVIKSNTHLTLPNTTHKKKNKIKSIEDNLLDENILEENKLEENTLKEVITEEDSIINSKIELIELYNNKLLESFYNIWTDSKINIVIGMIKYLLLETSPIDYVKCIETFIIPIDNDIYNIIHS